MNEKPVRYPQANIAADLALVRALAFWTGGDPDRIDSLFRQSALMRPKWDRADYRDRTIETALGVCTEHFTEPRPTPSAERLPRVERDPRPNGSAVHAQPRDRRSRRSPPAQAHGHQVPHRGAHLAGMRVNSGVPESRPAPARTRRGDLPAIRLPSARSAIAKATSTSGSPSERRPVDDRTGSRARPPAARGVELGQTTRRRRQAPRTRRAAGRPGPPP